MQNDSVNNQNPDEIDVLRIAGALWSRVWLIVGITALSGALGVTYAFLSERVYEAKAYLVPPTQSDIANINFGRTNAFELAPYSIEDVYRVFLRNLQSETLRREFFVNEYLPKLHDIQKSQPQDVLYSKFSKRIVVSPLSADLTGRYSVAVQTSSAEEAVSWVNNYVKRAESLAQDEIVKNVSYEAKVRARNLEHEINNERETGEKARGDSITKLREALIVAQAAGLQRPAMMLGNSPNGVVGSMEGDLVFMRGVEALSAEIKNLENRSSDDAFINHLRDLQGKQNFYKQLAAMPLELKMYRYDGSVELPDYAIKPKKALVILLALVLGVMLGVLFAFILHCFNDGRVGENIKSSNKA